MIVRNLSIFSLTLLSLGILSLFEPVKSWRKAFTERPFAGLLYGLSFLAVFLGNMTGGDIQTYTPDTVRYFRMLVLLVLFAIASARILGRPSNAIHAGIPSWLMVFYALLAMASAGYSQAPLLSLWKGFEVLAIVLVPISLSDQLQDWDDLRWLLDLLSLFLFFFVLSVLAGLIIAPQDAFHHINETSWSTFDTSGVFPLINPNSVTQLGAFVVALETIRILFRPGKNTETRKNILPLMTALAVVLLGHSRTSLFSLFLCLSLVFFYLRRGWFLVFFPTIAVLIASTKGYDFLQSYVLRGQDERAFLSMSGRTYCWEHIWRYFIQKPLIGYGYYAAHRVGFGTSGVDCAYLEVLLGLGVMGFVIFISPVIGTAFTLLKYSARTSAPEARQQQIWLQLTCLFGILFVRSLTGPSFEVLHHNLVIYAMLLTATSRFNRLWKAAPSSFRELESRPAEKNTGTDSAPSLLKGEEAYKPPVPSQPKPNPGGASPK